MSSCKRTPLDVERRQQDADMRDLGLVGIIILVGAVVSILFGIFDILGFGIGISMFSIVGIWNLVWGIIVIVLSIGMLTTLGFLPNVKFKISDQWIVMLIVGLVIFIPTGNWGGIIIIVAAILKLLKVDIKRK